MLFNEEPVETDFTDEGPEEKQIIDRKQSLVSICLELSSFDFDVPENKQIFEQKLSELGAKVENCIGFKQFVDSRISMLKNEEEFIHNQRKKLEAVLDRMSANALYAMNALGEKKLTSKNGHSMSIRETAHVKITNANILPEWALRRKEVITPNKMAIGEEIKAGRAVPGAELVPEKKVIFK